MGRWVGALLLLGLAAPGSAGETGPVVLLEVASRVGPDEVPEAAPPRFALFDDGQVFVGGSRELQAGRADKPEVKAIEAQIDKVRKLPGLGSFVSFGPGESRARLVVRKGRPLEIVATGDPAGAPPNLRPLVLLLQVLESFSNPTLRPYQPSGYLARAREARLVGGCRIWDVRLPALAELAAGPRVVAPELVGSWPHGAMPASVCAGGKRYVVTFRPLLPGERP